MRPQPIASRRKGHPRSGLLTGLWARQFHVAGATKICTLVNIHDAFLGHGIHATQFWREHYQVRDPHWWYYGNVEDPNDRGYDAIRRLFLIEMARVLGERN
jgi:hypothetical protein